MDQCEAEGCKYRARARGLCRRHGEMITGVPCSVPDCTNPARARGWCSMHYYRWHKTGDPGSAVRKRRGKRPCKVIDCANDAVTSDDLCPTHRRRKRLYGDENGMFSTHVPCAVCGAPSMHGTNFIDRCEPHAWDRVVEMYLAGELAGATDAKSGYVYLAVRKTRKGAHRAVMEREIGRELYSNENVHHRNGRRGDNRPENLELWVKPQPIGQRPEDLVAWVVDHYPEEARAALARISAPDLLKENPHG